MGNIISSKISDICGVSIIDGVDDSASAKEVDQKLHTPKLHQKDEQQLLSPSPTTVGTSDVVSDSSDMEDDETSSSFIGDISFDSLPLYEEPQEVKQKDVSLEPDTQLSSVATVILHHHLSNISDENNQLRKDNSKFDQVRSMLTQMCIHTEDDMTLAVLDISEGLVMDESITGELIEVDGQLVRQMFAVPFHQIPSEDLLGKRLIISTKDAEGIPLADLYEMTVSTRSNQKIGHTLGMQGCVHIGELDSEEETVNPTIVLAENISVQGSIYGLSEEDMDRFRARNNEEGFVAQAIMDYAESGTGLTDAEYAEFYPFSVTLGITSEVLKVLDAVAPVCRDSMTQDEKKALSDRDKLPVDPAASNDSIEYTTLISNIAEAVGCDDDQKKVLDENKKLVIESTALKALRDILGTIEIGSSSLKLEDGNLGVNTNEKLLWVFQADEEFTMAAKDIMKDGSVKLAGVNLNLSRDVLALADQGGDLMTGLVLSYDNGIKVIGLFDSPVAALDNDFFTSDMPVKLGKVLFDFTSIVKVLDALDVDYLETSGYYAGLPAFPDRADE